MTKDHPVNLVEKVKGMLVEHLAGILIAYIPLSILVVLGFSDVPGEWSTFSKLLTLLDQQQANLAVWLLTLLTLFLSYVILSMSDREFLRPDSSFPSVLTDGRGFQYCPRCKALLSDHNKYGPLDSNARYCMGCSILYQR